jgi:signal transduction histidine kinase
MGAVSQQRRKRGIAAPLALPVGFAALLAVGASAAATRGGLSGGWVLALAAVIVVAGSAVPEPAVAPVLGVIGWLTVIGFSRAPYAQLRPTGSQALLALLVIGSATLAGVTAGVVLRRVAGWFTLWIVDVHGEPPPDDEQVSGLSGDLAEPDAQPILPGSAEPALPGPAVGQPIAAEPEPVVPGRAEAALADPVVSQPAADPRPVLPARAEAAPPGPAVSQPRAEFEPILPARAEPALAGPAASQPVAGLAAATPPAASRPRASQTRVSQPRGGRRRIWELTGGIGRRRLLSGALLVAGLPLLTFVLSVAGVRRLGDDLLVYLVAVVAVAVVGGFWPAVIAAITASLLVNWYFTPPVHTLIISDGLSLLSLLLFITVAVTVSSVVHLAEHRARQAARSTGEAQELLALAQTVLGGADAPAAVLGHLTGGYGGRAELLERAAGQWVRVAASGDADDAAPTLRAVARDDLVLVVSGQDRPLPERLLHGYAAQAAAALDRDRLRTQAAQAEALAEGNRMRTALLAAVSHDLRTPLASIKASVSTLRQTDVSWTPADEAALLATIERSSDRLDALIGNLLDMSRLTTGSLHPFLRPTAIDEVAPVALRGLDEGGRLQLMVPDGLPLVRTDPGLLERVLANLFANALAYSPPRLDPELRASQDGASVLLDIVDHGPGASDELKGRMFEAFQRLEAGGTGPAPVPAAPGGIGLGLAVVRGFLDLMGGSVTAADTPGGGLTMRVRLPAVVELSDRATVSQASLSDQATQSDHAAQIRRPAQPGQPAERGRAVLPGEAGHEQRRPAQQ